MAAATENATRYTDYWGRTPVEIVNVTAGNGDTFESQWGSVIKASFENETNGAVGLTISGKTVSFVTGGSVTGVLTVYGNSE